MSKKVLLTAAGACLLLTSALTANHHHFVPAMKGVGGKMKPTNVALGSGDMATVKENAASIAQNFAIIAAWFEGRGNAGAVKIADEAHEGAVALGKAAAAGDAAAAKAAMGTIGGTCKSCHTAYRVKNADGSYGFKD